MMIRRNFLSGIAVGLGLPLAIGFDEQWRRSKSNQSLNTKMNPTWREVSGLLGKLAPKIDGHSFLYELQGVVTKPIWVGLLESVSHQEKPFVAEIESAIAEWQLGQSFQALAPNAAYWLNARCHAACAFAWLHTKPAITDSKIELPDPTGSLEEVIKFLLTKWWDRHGQKLHVQNVILDKYDQQKRD